MENLLSFDYCTIAAGKSVISSQKAAEKLIARRGFRGEVQLYRVINDANREEKTCWVCKYGDRVTHIMPIFRDEPPISVGNKYGIKKLCGDELIRNGDNYYRTYANGRGEMGIRSLLIFSDEQLVRAACQAKGLNVVSVTLVRIYRDDSREYLTAAWCVRCMECETDFALCFVDLRDGLALEGFNLLEDAVYEEIKEGEVFLAGDVIYALRKNNAGEFYIVRSTMQVCAGGKN